jgi:ABC-type transport system substrate-binding protein
VEESMVVENIKFSNLKYSLTGTAPYKGEWYPGQVYKYEHSVPLYKLIKPLDNWKKTNEGWKNKKTSFGLAKYSLDFDVQSHK